MYLGRLSSAVWPLLSFAFFATAAAQACVTTTAAASYPTTTATSVALHEYSYCGGTFNVSVFIENLCYNKIVNLYYTNGAGASTPLSVISLRYQSDASPGTWENWGASTAVYIDGITSLLNVTYDAVDVGHVYDQVLNLMVNASGAPIPTPTAPPAPYATPQGFSQDITTWLAALNGSEAGISKTRMFDNINVPEAALGTVIAAQSYIDPNYAYHWVRDASLTMDVVNDLYAAVTNSSAKAAYESILFEYAHASVVEQLDPTAITGLGEPKFNLNNTAFTGPWGRPQNDGPATRAITLMNFVTAYLANGGSMDTVKQQLWDSSTYPTQAPVMRDLQFVATNWTYPSFDLWEEVESDHFYTRMVQRRALIMGSAFATKMGDSVFSSTLSSAASAISATLPQFWDQARNLLMYEYGPVLRGKFSFKDVAVVLGVLHGYNSDNVYSPTNDQVLASTYDIVTSFLAIYALANETVDKTSGLPLGIPVGRYPEDTYNGIDTNGAGNPWYLCTTSVAELFYRATVQYNVDQQITVTATSLPFWQYFAPQQEYEVGKSYDSSSNEFEKMVSSLQGWADAFMRRVKSQTPSDGSLTEEYDRTSGAPQGARDLTWSYAALLTASFARAEAMGQVGYVGDLANL